MDLSKLILKSEVENTTNDKIIQVLKKQGVKITSSDLITTDSVFIASFDDVKRLKKSESVKSATDFALMYGVNQGDKCINDNLGLNGTFQYLRTPDKHESDLVFVVTPNGKVISKTKSVTIYGISPVLRLDLNETKKIIETNPEAIKIEQSKTLNGKIYYTLQMGEYPKNFANDEISEELERLYNNGNLNEELSLTGKAYTVNNTNPADEDDDFRHTSGFLAEFEYKGQKYVRVISENIYNGKVAQDGSTIIKNGQVRWVKVEPITFKIKNWQDLPKSLNPQGKGKAKFIEIETEQVIMGGLRYSPYVDDYSVLWQNSMIRAFLNGESIKNMHRNQDCIDNSDWDFTNIGFLQQAFDSTYSIKEYTIPKNEAKIFKYAFAHCTFLDKIVIPKHIKIIEKDAFFGCDFKFAYIDKDSSGLVLAKNLPENQDEIKNIVELNDLKRSFIGFDISWFVKDNSARGYYQNNNIANEEYMQRLIHLSKTLNKAGIKMPQAIVKILVNNPDYYSIIENFDFKFFKNEVYPLIQNKLDDIKHIENVYKTAISIGCFSKDSVTDNKGLKTQTTIGQKSSTLLSNILRNDLVTTIQMGEMFKKINLQLHPSSDFIKFISLQGENKKLVNLGMLLELSAKEPIIFSKVSQHFDKIQELRNTLDANGKPIKISWEDAILKFHRGTRYGVVADEYKDISDLYAMKGLSETAFSLAVNARKLAKEKNTTHHILGEELKELSILESIERIQKDTETKLQEAKPILDSLYAKQFTYEMLDKYDPKNGILGVYCNCCASLSSEYYGSGIAKASIVEDDVQNLVVKNIAGEIIAKGTMYLNKELSYVVINDFEINDIYKDEDKDKDRELIFDTFMRGIYAFVEKYDSMNPDKPITYVTVGGGYNRLLEQCETFEEKTKGLSVPSHYNFNDAKKTQYILYDRQKFLNEQQKNGGKEQ